MKMDFLRNKFNIYWRLMRLDQRAGIWLVLWPCLFAHAFTAGSVFDLKIPIILIIGSIFIRAAGCIINDFADIEFDKLVERTKNRPLTSGAISKLEAFILLVVFLLISLVLLLQLNKQAIIVGFLAIIPISIYPWLKRFTYWPQAFLGMTFNLGGLMTWVHYSGDFSYACMSFFCACIFWTVGYDTIYAHQDKIDDMRIGIKSTAIKFGDKTKEYLVMFYGLMLVCLVVTAKLMHMSYVFYIGVFLVAIHLYWQSWTLDINSSLDCRRKFLSNITLGWILFITIMVSRCVS